MTVPMADAIRKARRAWDEARRARVRVERCRAALRGIQLLSEQQLGGTALLGLPGDDLVEELRAEGDAPEEDPAAASPLMARRRWLDAVITRHEPLASEVERRLEVLHSLQAEQQRQLALPEHQELRERLSDSCEELERLSRECNDLEIEVLRLQTVRGTTDGLRQVLRDADQPGQAPEWQAALAADALASLRRILDEIGLDLELPEVSAHPTVLRDAVDALGDSLAVLDQRLAPLQARRDERRHLHEQLSRSVQGEMG